MAKFKNGESIVCIEDDFSATIAKYRYIGRQFTWPVRGKCYVLRHYACHGRFPALLLACIHNPRVKYTDGVIREAGFWEERFERAPGIEDLTKIATEVTRWCGAPETVRESEDA